MKSLLTLTLVGLVAATVFGQDAPAPPVLRIHVPAAQSSPSPTPEEKEPEVDEDDVVRVSTSLITIPAEVVDRNGRKDKLDLVRRVTLRSR